MTFLYGLVQIWSEDFPGEMANQGQSHHPHCLVSKFKQKVDNMISGKGD